MKLDLNPTSHQYIPLCCLVVVQDGLTPSTGSPPKLKRKLNGSLNSRVCLDLAGVQEELTFTQQELQDLRLQYAQLHRLCHDTLLGISPAMTPKMWEQQFEGPAMMATMHNRQDLVPPQVRMLHVCTDSMPCTCLHMYHILQLILDILYTKNVG